MRAASAEGLRLAGTATRRAGWHSSRSPLTRLLSFRPNWSKVSAEAPVTSPPSYQPPPPPQPWGVSPPSPPPPPLGSGKEIVPTTNLDQVQVRAGLEVLLAEPYVAIQRRLEVANLLIGFEQANHYTIYNRHGAIVGYMAEENTSMKSTVLRQVAKVHRPFTATIFDAHGSILMRVERPFYFVSTSLFVRDAYRREIGEVHMKWHLWRRRYSLYQDKRQFALIDAPWLSWEFTCEDEQGRAVAAVDKNFAGLGTIVQTLFTDAHTYLCHLNPGSPLYDFAARPSYAAPSAVAANERADAAVTAPARLPPGWDMRLDAEGRPYYVDHSTKSTHWDPPANTPAEAREALVTAEGDVAKVGGVGPELSLEEKAVVLACAISIDFDYFSRHSGGGGIPLPFFIPVGGGGADAGGAAGATADVAEGVGLPSAGDGGWESGASMDPVEGQGGWSEGGGEAGWSESPETHPQAGEEVWGEGEEVWKGGANSDGGQEGGGLIDIIRNIFDV